MYKYLLVVLVAAFTLNAQESPKKPRTGGPDPVPSQTDNLTSPPPSNKQPEWPRLTEQQKKQRAELVFKYDVNKDGQLDWEERLKVSDQDRKLMRSFGPPPGGPGGPRGPRGPKHDGPPPTKDGDRPSKPHKKD